MREVLMLMLSDQYPAPALPRALNGSAPVLLPLWVSSVLHRSSAGTFVRSKAEQSREQHASPSRVRAMGFSGTGGTGVFSCHRFCSILGPEYRICFF